MLHRHDNHLIPQSSKSTFNDLKCFFEMFDLQSASPNQYRYVILKFYCTKILMVSWSCITLLSCTMHWANFAFEETVQPITIKLTVEIFCYKMEFEVFQLGKLREKWKKRN